MANIFSTKNCILLIIVLGLLVYFNILFNKFVLDDPSQIIGNSAIHSLANIPSLFLGSSFGGGGGAAAGIYYKPLMSTFYTIIYSLFGSQEFFFHLFQLILHISNAVLVFLLLKRFFKPGISLFLALIFLVHPQTAEAVQYISNLQDILFFFFGMLALLSPNLILWAIFIILSLMSKEAGVLFLIMSVIQYSSLRARRAWQSIRFLLLSLTILVFYLILRYLAVGLPVSTEHIFPIERIPFLERLSNIPAIIFYYLKTYFWPQNLAVGQQWIISSLSFKEFYLPLLISLIGLIGLISIACLSFGKFSLILRLKSKIFTFFSIWFLIGLGLHLHFIPLDATVADRWMYFPSVGLLGMIGVALTVIASEQRKRTTYVGFLAMTIIILFSTRTIIRNTDWQDGLTLAKHDTASQSPSFVMENNLSFELIQAGDYNQALIHSLKSTQLVNNWWLSWNNLGVIYRHKKDLDKTQQAFQKSIDQTNTFYMPYENMAEFLFNFRNPQQSLDFINETQKKLPLNSHLLFTLAISEVKLGQIDKATEHSKASYTLDPNNNLSFQLYQALINNQKIDIKTPEY